MPDNADIFEANILIVDDQVRNIALLERLLHSAGYQHISSTSDPFAVCDLYRANTYDLILLDLEMPGLDGFGVMQALGDIESSGYAPVLAVTAQPDYKLRALAAGARDFVAKPFDVVELKTRIYNLLEVRLLYKKLEQAVAALERFALHDALTGLPNRRFLMERLQQALVSSHTSGEYCALMFMDLDHFKQLNDTLGHDMGDVLLQQVSARLLLCVGEGNDVARFGGDEFVVLLSGLNRQPQQATAEAQAVALKILRSLKQSYKLKGHAYDSTLSIGFVVFVGNAEPMGDLLKKADLAMYQAKSLGRNQVCFFDGGMQQAVLARDTLARDLRLALTRQEFVLYYQIQVNAQGEPVGAQAQLRWKHPTQGVLLPAQFLTLAEEIGMILPLGQWVLEAACQQLKGWAQEPATQALTLSVHIGTYQLAQADFANRVATALLHSGAPAARLMLALAEGSLVNDVEDVIVKMNAVKALDVRFCLNDFGAGFPSLAHLKLLPLAQLKVDQVMVQTVLNEAPVAVIACAIVALGLSLGLPVLAEGIATLAQRDFFAGIGCQVFQGDYFGPALPPLDLLRVYMENRPVALVNQA